MIQQIFEINGQYEILDAWIEKNDIQRIMLVCGKSITIQTVNKYFVKLSALPRIKIIRFMDFQPNPLYESVVKGVELFRKEKCDGIIAIGGGSAIDVAKCIKLYCNMDADKNYLKQVIIPNKIPFLVMPTTAGTGSEATRYAVIYYGGKKQSVSDDSCIPDTVLMDSSCLKVLPIYQKKATMMDALCHAIESFWSVNSTDESKAYSKNAIKAIIANMEGYLTNTEEGNTEMLMAAHIAGKAINITQTSAGHAMCYKITSLFGLAHGHAAILCDKVLFSWMIRNTDKCIDPRGEEYLKKTLDELSGAMGCKNAEDGVKKLVEIFDSLDLQVPVASKAQYEELKTSVNLVRLKNHPIYLSVDTIDRLYHKILR